MPNKGDLDAKDSKICNVCNGKQIVAVAMLSLGLFIGGTACGSSYDEFGNKNIIKVGDRVTALNLKCLVRDIGMAGLGTNYNSYNALPIDSKTNSLVIEYPIDSMSYTSGVQGDGNYNQVLGFTSSLAPKDLGQNKTYFYSVAGNVPQYCESIAGDGNSYNCKVTHIDEESKVWAKCADEKGKDKPAMTIGTSKVISK